MDEFEVINVFYFRLDHIGKRLVKVLKGLSTTDDQATILNYEEKNQVNQVDHFLMPEATWMPKIVVP
jgi:hypothetical protein